MFAMNVVYKDSAMTALIELNTWLMCKFSERSPK